MSACTSRFAPRRLFGSARFARSISTAGLLVLAALGALPLQAAPEEVTAVSAGKGGCGELVLLAPGETWRDPGYGDPGTCWAVEVDTDGWLIADLLQGADSSAARLLWTDRQRLGTAVVHYSATSLILAVTPGRYRLQVLPDDPETALAPFRLQVDLVEIAGEGERDTELELEPDPLTAGCHNGEGDTELELEPDPLTGAPAADGPRVSAWLQTSGDGVQRLCHRGSDDHGDRFVCATPMVLGRSMTAQLGNEWGDDLDVFRFRVSALEPVEITVRGVATFFGGGGGELTAELYDRAGQRLAVLPQDTALPLGATGLRLLRTLVPGTYLLRIGGRDLAEGEYSVRVGAPGRGR